jgi:hypothetical protein
MRRKSQTQGASPSESTELTNSRLLCAKQADELAQLKQRLEASESIAANAKNGLVFVQEDWKGRIAEAELETARAKSDYVILEQKNSELVRTIALRFEEIAALTKLLLQQQNLEDEFADHVSKIAELETQNSALKERLARLDAELQKLAQQSVTVALSSQPEAASSKSIVGFLAPWSGKERRKNERRVIEHQVTLLRASGLFDETWYQERYPDVKTSATDPVLHYLIHGAKEGRDPGPLFSTQEYFSTYPDVAASNLNPLLHYIRFGGKEGRLIQGAI